MPYIEQLSQHRLQKVITDNEVSQTRRLKSISQVIRIDSEDIEWINISKFNVTNPEVYYNGLKLIDSQFIINGQDIKIPNLKVGDIIEVIQTMDKPDSVEYFPLVYTENVAAQKTVFILPWTYNSGLRNITIFQNGVLTDRSQYNCTQDDIVTFNTPINIGTKVTFFSANPTVASESYGEYFNTFPILGTIDYYGLTPPPGFLAMEGQILYRSEYPTAWLILTNHAIPDNEWTGNPENKIKFSSGDGETTFRMPDNRSDNPNCIRCIKLWNSSINTTSGAIDIYGVEKSVTQLNKRFDCQNHPKNLIINGSCVVNTRGGAVKTTGVGYCLDRWLIWRNLAEASVTQEFEGTGVTASRRFMRINTYIGDEDESGISLHYRLENVFKYSRKNLTLSLMGRGSRTAPVYAEVYLNFGPSGFTEMRNIAGCVLSFNSEWNRVGFSFELPEITQYQIDQTGGYIGIALWLSANFGIPNANNIGQREATFDMTDFQLEEGTFMTNLSQLPPAMENSLCQYYCRKYKTRRDPEELGYSMRDIPNEYIDNGKYIYDAEIY